MLVKNTVLGAVVLLGLTAGQASGRSGPSVRDGIKRGTKYSSFASAVIVLGLSSAEAFAATATYIYTGPQFINVSGPYTTSNSITGSFDLTDPLGPNLTAHVVMPTSFSFTDGVQTITSTMPFNPFTQFAFSTNSQGLIINWDIAVILGYGATGAGSFINTEYPFHADPRTLDQGVIDTLTSRVSGYVWGVGYFTRDGVLASVQPPPSVPPSLVPIPAAWSLLASGLGALGFLGWRRKRKLEQKAA